MVPHDLQIGTRWAKNGAQCCFSNFDSRFFRCKFFVKALSMLLPSFTLSHFHKSSPNLLEEIYLYSGFTFSHYDLPFPTRYCIPYVRSGLYQLVIRVKGFRVSAHDLDSHCIRFYPSAWTPRFQRVELCITSARTTLAVSAVVPS